MTHENRRRFYVEAAVQILLTERPAALPEIEFYAEVHLDNVLDIPYPVA
jgi:hypothetical protein